MKQENDMEDGRRFFKGLLNALLIMFCAAAVYLLLFETAKSQVPETISWSWTAPTTNENGTPLTDLAGYVVHFGPASRVGRCADRPTTVSGDACYPEEIVVDTTTSAQFTLNLPGVYYTSVVAFDQSGNVSKWSEEKNFTLTINTRPNPPTNLTVDCEFSTPDIVCTTG